MNIIGRMTFQVPGGMAITGAMLQWYRCVNNAKELGVIDEISGVDLGLSFRINIQRIF